MSKNRPSYRSVNIYKGVPIKSFNKLFEVFLKTYEVMIMNGINVYYQAPKCPKLNNDIANDDIYHFINSLVKWEKRNYRKHFKLTGKKIKIPEYLPDLVYLPENAESLNDNLLGIYKKEKIYNINQCQYILSDILSKYAIKGVDPPFVPDLPTHAVMVNTFIQDIVNLEKEYDKKFKVRKWFQLNH